MNAAASLRTLLEPGRPLVHAPGAFDSLTARLVEQAGFPAVYLTGFGATASRLGQPDIGLLTATEMTEHARNMVRAVSVPVIADADNGYGGPSNIHRTVLEYQQAGVAAIHLEDQVSPKRCGQMAGISLVDAEDSARRVKAAVVARGADDLVVIARTDALAATSREDAVERIHRYRDAGADLLFVDGVKTISDVEFIARSVDGPTVVSLVDGTEAASLTGSDLDELGFRMVLYPLTALFSATSAVQRSLHSLHDNQTVPASAMDYAQYTEVVGLPFHQHLDETFGQL
ncbi:isocitrate lyase/PEP mutase family protein [Cellulosimicrobium funkei]|nr:isocitrate lyase/PEP mutase family protein [Cellulosimicrobium funkei]